MTDIKETGAMKAFTGLCATGWSLGFHERNGGNVSLRLSGEDADLMAPYFSPGAWTALPVSVPSLAGELFLVTGSGKYIQDAARDPEENVCAIELDGAGSRYRILWGLVNGGSPTSELCSHLLCHQAAGSGKRVMYHCHPAAIVALTYILPPDAGAFTNALWRSMTECPIAAPRGVGVLPWIVPGSIELGRRTCELLKCYDAAVWAHHGLFCAGRDCKDAVGMAHTLEKSADIYIKILSTGRRIRQTVSDTQLRALAEAYGLRLNTQFLDGSCSQ